MKPSLAPSGKERVSSFWRRQPRFRAEGSLRSGGTGFEEPAFCGGTCRSSAEGKAGSFGPAGFFAEDRELVFSFFFFFPRRGEEEEEGRDSLPKVGKGNALGYDCETEIQSFQLLVRKSKKGRKSPFPFLFPEGIAFLPFPSLRFSEGKQTVTFIEPNRSSSFSSEGKRSKFLSGTL